MLGELQQLLACRRERENRAAALLRQARQKLERAKADADAAYRRIAQHHQERQERQDKLYRDSLRARLSKDDIDDLNLELDLMAEKTDALTKEAENAAAAVGQAEREVEQAQAVYRRHRQAGDRFGHLVDDVAEKEKRTLAAAEEFAIEDELGDRRAASSGEI